MKLEAHMLKVDGTYVVAAIMPQLYACDRCGDVKVALPNWTLPRGWRRLHEDFGQQHCGRCQLETSVDGWLYERMG